MSVTSTGQIICLAHCPVACNLRVLLTQITAKPCLCLLCGSCMLVLPADLLFKRSRMSHVCALHSVPSIRFLTRKHAVVPQAYFIMGPGIVLSAAAYTPTIDAAFAPDRPVNRPFKQKVMSGPSHASTVSYVPIAAAGLRPCRSLNLALTHQARRDI